MLALSDARLHETLEKNAVTIRRDADTIQLGVNYRGSALVRDDRADTAGLRAGDRAPDATELVSVDGECRLFDLIRGGRFTLLDFRTRVPDGTTLPELAILRVVGRPTGPGDVADAGGHLAHAYGATDRTLVLIRPDGYIGLISDAGDLSAVSDHLAASG